MLVFVTLAKAPWAGGRETHAELSVVVRKGRKMLKQAAERLFAEMAVHTHTWMPCQPCCEAGRTVPTRGKIPELSLL